MASAAAVVAFGYAAVGYAFLHRSSEADHYLPLIAEATSRRYTRAGAYPWPVRSSVGAPNVKIGADRVPVVLYPGRGWQPNPVTVAQWGLWNLRGGTQTDAVRAADWLLAQQRSDGRWLYGFRFWTAGATMKPPWGSALAQAQAISLLTRVYRITGDRRYLAGARRALDPILTPVADGGMLRSFHGDRRFPWYEEYPAERPTYVLNGFMFTLVGLYDLAPYDRRAAGAYEAGRRTLLHALPAYTIAGRSIYDLVPGRRDYIPASYLAVEISLLRTLASIAPTPELERAAAVREKQIRAI